jgi:hypothetical protein
MNATFNLERFVRLFSKHTAEHYKKYLMSLIVLIGVMVLGGSFLVYMVEIPIDVNMQSGLFLIILILAGTIFTSTIFADLGERKKAISWLTLPASHFEKYLVALIYSLILFMILYTISFFLVLEFVIHIKNRPGYQPLIFNVFEYRITEMYLMYAFLHSIAFCGAIWFEKLHFIKTAFVFFIAIAILIVINKMMLTGLLGRAVEATPPFGNLRFADQGNIVDLNINTAHKDKYLVPFISLLTLIFWIAAYYRLKEKQV